MARRKWQLRRGAVFNLGNQTAGEGIYGNPGKGGYAGREAKVNDEWPGGHPRSF